MAEARANPFARSRALNCEIGRRATYTSDTTTTDGGLKAMTAFRTAGVTSRPMAKRNTSSVRRAACAEEGMKIGVTQMTALLVAVLLVGCAPRLTRGESSGLKWHGQS